MKPEEAHALEYQWRGFWARPNQLRPGSPGAENQRKDWRFWVCNAGRGWGKTRTGAETVREWAEDKNARIMLIAPTANDVREVMMEGPGGLMSCYPPADRPEYIPFRGLIQFKSGAIGITKSAEDPERLRGFQFTKFWADELCLASGTLIQTPDGERAIECIKPGDFVNTRSGPRRVVNSGRTDSCAQVFRLRTVGGLILDGTFNHPVWANDRFTPLLELLPGDILEVWQDELNGAVKSGGSTAEAIGCPELENCYTEQSGNPSTAQSLKEFTSTTKTKIGSTIPSKILKRLQRASITQSIRRAAGQLWELLIDVFNPSNAGRIKRLLAEHARDVDPRLRASQPLLSFVQEHVQPQTGSKLIQGSNALSAESDSPQPIIPGRCADRVKSIERLMVLWPVYNLEVEGDHEYYANGILVHNCAWSYPQESWDQIMFGFRLKSDDLQGLITTTPKPLPTYKKILKDPRTVVSRGSSYENKTNLSSEFFDTILARYENTRLGRQEINAEILEDVEGALWNRSMLDDHRVMLRDVPPLLRIVVAIDPAVSALESSDETGIIIAGIAANGHCYVLEDRSGKYSPADWVRQAVQGWAQYRADRIVAEVNNGGDLVEMAVRSFPGSGGCIPFTKIHSTRGKAKRAEPVAALYERGRVHHVLPAPQFNVLEEQLVSFVPGVETGTKDDRLDALCFAVSELAISPTPLEGRVVSSDRVSISRF